MTALLVLGLVLFGALLVKLGWGPLLITRDP
ncbi:hypothetical protein OOU_Y34scaffold00285g2 [Pyricularia oryzae Y34]|uniref:Uncharacterized protein n=3 Tax=Pyricularia oryzae TaxID=318829 RepID=Q2KEW2_PYRO7|nr:hypothetical protein MGCH7_ch7g924 [Pyricularia oryzae 70-15]ELQ41295.1 hypothetical protein OOU_Y34scaffold00285g2 [Pyricularia oryzae Y34]